MDATLSWAVLEVELMDAMPGMEQGMVWSGSCRVELMGASSDWAAMMGEWMDAR